MFPSIFTDELGVDLTESIATFRDWGLTHVDLRGGVFGKAAEWLDPDELPRLRKLLDEHGLKVGCLQSSLAKVHLPDDDRQRQEADKLEGLLRAADALDCRMVRAFFYWQPPPEARGRLVERPDEQQKVLDLFSPLARRAAEAGLVIGFENCGVMPDEVFFLCQALGYPNWGLAWDVRNTWDCDERREDEDAFIRRMVKQSVMVHVKARGAVEGLDEFTIPYDKVLQACHNGGVPGSVAVETHAGRDADEKRDLSWKTLEVVRRAWPSAAPGGLDEAGPSVENVSRPWDDRPVGFLVVGLGMGHNRSKMIRQTPGCRLVGVSDLREDRAQRTAEECDVPWETDFRTFLDHDDVEVVFVVTETGNHAPVALEALRAGKHVLTTKPMEASVAACDEMIRLAERSGLLLGCDFNRRYLDVTCSLKRTIAEGRLGRILSGTCHLKILRTDEYFRENGQWRGTRKLDGGGVFSNQAIHHIDEIAYTVGIPRRVRAEIRTLTHDIEAEDLGSALWEYQGGAMITLHATTNYPHPTWYSALELTGTEGAFARAGGGPFDDAWARYYVDGAWTDDPPVPASPEWLNAADSFAAALRQGAELTCPGRDGRRTQAILEAMYVSAYDAGGGWVEVEPELD